MASLGIDTNGRRALRQASTARAPPGGWPWQKPGARASFSWLTLRALAHFAPGIAWAESAPLAAPELAMQISHASGVASSLLSLALGFVLSLLGSLPMTGPLALLVLDRVLVGQRRSAFWIALAGALVEGAIAALIATFLPLVLQHSTSLVRLGRLSGAIVIFIVGLGLVLRPQTVTELETGRPRESLLVGFLATSLNPTLLATWTIAVTALHTNGLLEGGLAEGPAFGGGVVLGVLGWFALLVGLGRLSAPERMQRHRAALGRSVGGILLLVSALTFLHLARDSGAAQGQGEPALESR